MQADAEWFLRPVSGFTSVCHVSTVKIPPSNKYRDSLTEGNMKKTKLMEPAGSPWGTRV